MSKITSSATKIVLLFIIGVLGFLALIAGIYSILTQTFSEASKIILAAFGVVLNMVCAFYFAYKGETGPTNTIATTTATTETKSASVDVLPFAGK